MNRTIKDATVKRYFYETHAELRRHLADFVAAYNVSAVPVPLPVERKNSLQFIATRHCKPLTQSFASDWSAHRCAIRRPASAARI